MITNGAGTNLALLQATPHIHQLVRHPTYPQPFRHTSHPSIQQAIPQIIRHYCHPLIRQVIHPLIRQVRHPLIHQARHL